MANKEKWNRDYDRPGEYIMVNLTNRKKRKIYVHSKAEYDLILNTYNLKFK